jgi:hypothetical protein
MEVNKSKDEVQTELDKLCEINLIDFLCKEYGYEIDEEETRKKNNSPDNPKNVFLFKEVDPANGNSATKLLISRVNKTNGTPYLYKNVWNDLDNGNIFNFLKRRETDKYSIPYAKKRIYNYIKNVEKGFYKDTKIPSSLKNGISKHGHSRNTEEKMAEMAGQYQSLPNFTDRAYLLSRGLSNEILSSPMLKNRIKNEIMYEYVGTRMVKKVQYVNTVFPIYGLDPSTGRGGVCGYVRKNAGFKKTAADSLQGEGIWLSRIDKDIPLRNIVLCENPIDGISYVQSKINWKEENTLILASNGEITKRQLELYQEAVSGNTPARIILANDNCPAGQTFNAKILATLQLPAVLEDAMYIEKNKLLVNADLEIIRMKGGNQSEIIWHFSHDSNKTDVSKEDFVYEHIPAFQRVIEHYEELNKELYLVNDEDYPFTIEKHFHENKSEIRISFLKSADNWLEINKSIHALKFDYSEHIKIEVPKNKDFNDDLQEQLGIKTFTDHKDGLDESSEEKKNNSPEIHRQIN